MEKPFYRKSADGRTTRLDQLDHEVSTREEEGEPEDRGDHDDGTFLHGRDGVDGTSVESIEHLQTFL